MANSRRTREKSSVQKTPFDMDDKFSVLFRNCQSAAYAANLTKYRNEMWWKEAEHSISVYFFFKRNLLHFMIANVCPTWQPLYYVLTLHDISFFWWTWHGAGLLEPHPIKRHLKDIFGVKSTSDPNSVQKLTFIAKKKHFFILTLCL